MSHVTLGNYPALQRFLHEQEAATLSVPVDNQGTLHAASLLYAHTEQPLALYFVTGRDTQKCLLLHTRPSIPAACVIGTVRGVDFTLQLRGTLAFGTLSGELRDQYYKKRGNRHDDINDPKNTCLVFTPNWARFTDYSKDYARFFLDLA